MNRTVPNAPVGKVLPFPDMRAQRQAAERAASLSLLERLRDIERACIERERRHAARAVVRFSRNGGPTL